MKYFSSIFCIFIATTMFSSCKHIPEGATAVKPFKLEQYLGDWYEVARLDNRFERNMNNTTASYSLREDGNVKVVNRGYDTIKNKYKKATGIAKFRGATDVAMLKVSFFRPFYSSYNVIALDKDYQYALVIGKNLKYLWILSRTKTLPGNIKSDYLQLAKKIGYDTTSLIWVKHDQ